MKRSMGEVPNRWRVLFCAGALLGSTACRGAKPPAGSPTQIADAPEWVHKGSRAAQGSVFGVGAVQGIKNTELARTSAGNRGRAEISKILEVYSASLMKDFQESVTAGNFKASDDAQLVSQAIKTFSANLMNGTELKEYWLDPSRNVWYALVELNFERSRETAALKAKMSDGVKAWLDKNGSRVLGDLEQEGGGGRPPEVQTSGDEEGGDEGGATTREPDPPPVPEPVKSSPPPLRDGASNARGDEGPSAKVGGPAPAWTQGRCDAERTLCGVGDGRDRKTADIDARAEIARIFQSNITSVAKSFEGAAREISSKTGETWTETQQVSQFSMVSTDKVVTMSEIIERWDDGKGRLWSLAVVDRAQAGSALRDQIEQKDGVVASHLSRARGAGDDKLAKFKSLKAAVLALAEREALNADLRVIDRSGRGIAAPHGLGEILELLGSAAEALSIGVAVSGSGSDRVQACLEEAMTAKGYQIQAKSSEEDVDIDGSFDVLIKGSVKAEKRGEIAGSEVVSTTLTLKLIHGKTKKILRTFTASEKGSRGDIKSAASTSAFKICQKKVKEIVADIDASFSR